MSTYAGLLSPLTIKGRTFRDHVFPSAHAPVYAVNGLPSEHTCDILREVGCDGAGIEATVAARVLHAENAEPWPTSSTTDRAPAGSSSRRR